MRILVNFNTQIPQILGDEPSIDSLLSTPKKHKVERTKSINYSHLSIVNASVRFMRNRI